MIEYTPRPVDPRLRHAVAANWARRARDDPVVAARRAFSMAWDFKRQADDRDREIDAVQEQIHDVLTKALMANDDLDAERAINAETRAEADNLMAEAWRLYRLLPPDDQKRVRTR